MCYKSCMYRLYRSIWSKAHTYHCVMLCSVFQLRGADHTFDRYYFYVFGVSISSWSHKQQEKKMFHFRKINWMRRRPLISHVNTQTHTKRCVNLCQKRLALNVLWVDVSLYVWKSGSVKLAYLMSCCQHHLTDWRMKSLCWVALRVFLLFISNDIWIVLACNSAIRAILLNVIHKQTNGKTLKINCIYSHYRDCHSMLYILQMLCHVKVLKVYYI